jgi:hypothetical protein
VIDAYRTIQVIEPGRIHGAPPVTWIVRQILIQLPFNRLQDRRKRARIAAVALFGDPKFNGGQPEADVAATGYSPHRGGVIVKWPGMHAALRTVPQDLVPRFHSYCISNDPICNWTAQWTAICWVARLPVSPGRQVCPHADYVEQQWPKVAAYWAADLIHRMQLAGNITSSR